VRPWSTTPRRVLGHRVRPPWGARSSALAARFPCDPRARWNNAPWSASPISISQPGHRLRAMGTAGQRCHDAATISLHDDVHDRLVSRCPSLPSGSRDPRGAERLSSAHRTRRPSKHAAGARKTARGRGIRPFGERIEGIGGKSLYLRPALCRCRSIPGPFARNLCPIHY